MTARVDAAESARRLLDGPAVTAVPITPGPPPEARPRGDHLMRLNLSADRRAVTAMEYGLIASLVAVAIIAAVSELGTGIAHTFAAVTSKL